MMQEVLVYLERVSKETPHCCLEMTRCSQLSCVSSGISTTHSFTQGEGRGMTAGGKRTASTYWEATKRHLLTYAEQFVEGTIFHNGDTEEAGAQRRELFGKLATAFCESFAEHVRENDYGWFEMLASEDEDTIAQVADFREIRRWLLAYSPNEAFFGQVN